MFTVNSISAHVPVSCAVIVQLVDWAQAFDRQCPRLGIQSFLKYGVLKSIIPVLISYFQNRRMKVKWKSHLSSSRELPGGGPQGSSLGLIEYDSQSNDNTDFLSPEDKYKFVDDLSTLEIINLIMAGLSCPPTMISELMHSIFPVKTFNPNKTWIRFVSGLTKS